MEKISQYEDTLSLDVLILICKPVYLRNQLTEPMLGFSVRHYSLTSKHQKDMEFYDDTCRKIQREGMRGI